MKIAIVTDIHEDYPALQKALQKIEKAGYDKLVCLGDISGFSVPYYKYSEQRDAHGCLSLLREKEALIVPGNHDFYAAKRIPEESAVFVFPPDWYSLDYAARMELSKGKIWLHEERDLDPLYTREDIAYLQSLDEYSVETAGSTKILFSHYLYPNLSGFKQGFYISAKEFSQHFDFMTTHDCTIGFSGHAHVRGFYAVTPMHFRHHPYGTRQVKAPPEVIGVPPVTRHKKRNGYGMFDTDQMKYRAVKL